jgi:hypothetical protein
MAKSRDSQKLDVWHDKANFLRGTATSEVAEFQEKPASSRQTGFLSETQTTKVCRFWKNHVSLDETDFLKETRTSEVAEFRRKPVSSSETDFLRGTATSEVARILETRRLTRQGRFLERNGNFGSRGVSEKMAA